MAYTPLTFANMPAMPQMGAGMGDSMNQLTMAMAGGNANATPTMTADALAAVTQGNANGGGIQTPDLTGATGPDAAGGPLASKFLGMNLDTAKLALGGLQTLGNLFMGMKALKMAKEQFNYQKGVTETNLVNSIQSYNTSLQDRANNRQNAVNGTAQAAQEYVDAHKAVRL